MNKRSKLIVSVIGLCAIIIPALLLIFFSAKTQKEPQINLENRTIDAKSIQDAVKKTPQKAPDFPSPYVSTSSAKQATSSAKPR